MNIDAILVSLLRPTIHRATRKALVPRVGAQEAASILAEATRRYHEQTRIPPDDPTVGGRAVVRLAMFTVALFRSLGQHGISDAEAQRLTAEVTWKVYQKLNWLPWKLTRLKSADPLARAKQTMDLAMRFPYTPPSYRMEYVDAGMQTVGFDVRRCPIAEYFRHQGLPDLCAATFCDLDFPLAEEWGLRLDRHLTLARGADYCDFRFRRPEQTR